MRQFISSFGITILMVASAQGLRAKDRCDARDFAGTYGMSAAGSILGVPDPALTALIGPFARVGVVEADGKEKVTVTNTASYNGLIVTETYSGTYKVNAACGLEVDVLVPIPVPGTPIFTPPFPFTFVGSLADGGRDGSVVLTFPPGAPIRVHLLRQDSKPGTGPGNSNKCSNGDLNGGYQLDLFGTNVSELPVGPIVREGTLTFDGKSKFTANTITNSAGLVINADNFIGDYSVAASCSVSISFTLNATLYTWTGELTENSSSAFLIQTAPARTVIAGSLKKQ